MSSIVQVDAKAFVAEVNKFRRNPRKYVAEMAKELIFDDTGLDVSAADTSHLRGSDTNMRSSLGYGNDETKRKRSANPAERWKREGTLDRSKLGVNTTTSSSSASKLDTSASSNGAALNDVTNTSANKYQYNTAPNTVSSSLYL